MKHISTLTIVAALAVLSSETAFCTAEHPPQTGGSRADAVRQMQSGATIQENQPTPTDVSYSLERYNLIRRTYWVNGHRERARALPCPVTNPPLGYIVLLTQNGAVVGKFVVSGKVSSLNSYLTPDSEYYSLELSGGNASTTTIANRWLPDVDGCYGKNDNGIFFFTPDGKYIEWNGTYLYSDIPFDVKNPVVTISQSQQATEE